MIAFTKMHGLSNDFMVIDNRKDKLEVTRQLVRQLANRHTGVGFDQLLLLENTHDPQADFHYRIFNADGGEVAQCGNGARCLAAFIYDQKISSKTPLIVATSKGKLTLTRLDKDLIEVALAIPKFNANAIPTQLTVEDGQTAIIVEDFAWPCGVVNLGNPHVVFNIADHPHFKNNPLEKIDIESFAKPIQESGVFQEGVNVGVMKILTAEHIQLRVYERGAGETQACGSGAAAAMVVGRYQDRLDANVLVSLRGGSVQVNWPSVTESVRLIGQATTVYHGTIDLGGV